MCPGILHVMDQYIGFLGVLFIPEDWQVRVFLSSGIVDRLSYRLYVRMEYFSVWLYGHMLLLHILLHIYLIVLYAE